MSEFSLSFEVIQFQVKFLFVCVYVKCLLNLKHAKFKTRYQEPTWAPDAIYNKTKIKN